MRSYLLSTLLLVFLSCGGDPTPKEPADSPTQGTITVACDESIQPIADAEAMVFESLYPNAKLNMVYVSEGEAVDMLLSDSARIALLTRELNEEELARLKDQQISHARYHKLGFDAVAFVLNNANPDTSFTLKQVEGLMTGEISDWSQIRKGNKLGPIKIVFDHPRSGAIRLLKDSVLRGRPLGKTCFALKSNPEVIEYVKQTAGSIGIIGVSWISDTDDVQSKSFLKSLKVAEIQPVLLRVNGITNKPIQGNIALKQYPYWRPLMVVSREMRTGLGTGFASFIESEPGQKILLKGGLVPCRSSIRTVTITE